MIASYLWQLEQPQGRSDREKLFLASTALLHACDFDPLEVTSKRLILNPRSVQVRAANAGQADSRAGARAVRLRGASARCASRPPPNQPALRMHGAAPAGLCRRDAAITALHVTRHQ